MPYGVLCWKNMAQLHCKLRLKWKLLGILCSAKTGHRYLWPPMSIQETRMPPASTVMKVKHSLQTVLHRILNVSLTFRGLASAVNVMKEMTCNTLGGTCLLHQFILKHFWEFGRVSHKFVQNNLWLPQNTFMKEILSQSTALIKN